MNSEKIMVVEDEWIVSERICKSLEDFGYTVNSTASTGDEAIRKVKADRPDLILMDIVLKGKMDGIEAADRINSQFNIPMIYLTAYTNPEYIERAKQTNPFSYLVKPFNKKELYANIEMALHSHLADKADGNVLSGKSAPPPCQVCRHSNLQEAPIRLGDEIVAEALRILILEDNPDDAELVQFELREAGLSFTAKVVMKEKDYIRELQKCFPDLILSDYDLPKYNGALALAEARRRCPDTPFILVTGAVSEDRAIEVLTQGAKDYVLKTRLELRLVPAVRRALAQAGEHRARKQAEAELREAYRSMAERVKIRTGELETEMAARKKMQAKLRESDSQKSAYFIELRRQAEERVKVNKAASGPSGMQDDPQMLLHELQVYQIQLEMLNEELRQSKIETEALLAKYIDIYDFAPIGYFTLDANGIILQVNLTGARLLGVERSHLTGHQFRIHIEDDFCPTFNAFFRKTFEGKTIENCELMLSPKENAPSRFVQLEARLSEDRKEFNLVMIDITKRKRSDGESAEHSC